MSYVEEIDRLTTERDWLQRRVDMLVQISNVNGDWNVKFLHEKALRDELTAELDQARALLGNSASRVDLAVAWNRGYADGWRDGVSDATEDEPGPQHRNPYRGFQKGQ